MQDLKTGLKGLPLAGAVVVAGLASSPASAFDFAISGQVDRAATFADNGEDNDIGFVDNTGSNTRFRFVGDQTLESGLNVGFIYEIGLGEKPLQFVRYQQRRRQ